jgi:hypothetical protein
LFPLVTVPRMTRGREAAAFFWSSSRFARFFCVVRRGLSFARGLYTEGGGGVEGMCDVDDDADANVAAASLEAAEKKVQDVQ